MKTQYYTATTLDGFLATEEDSLAWLFPLGDMESSSYPAFIAEVGALAMGSSTYTWMLDNIEQVQKETGESWPYSPTGLGIYVPETPGNRKCRYPIRTGRRTNGA